MRLQKYVTPDIALNIYKQIILPLFDYTDFMVESGPKGKIDKLERREEKALRCIDNVV